MKTYLNTMTTAQQIEALKSGNVKRDSRNGLTSITISVIGSRVYLDQLSEDGTSSGRMYTADTVLTAKCLQDAYVSTADETQLQAELGSLFIEAFESVEDMPNEYYVAVRYITNTHKVGDFESSLKAIERIKKAFTTGEPTAVQVKAAEARNTIEATIDNSGLPVTVQSVLSDDALADLNACMTLEDVAYALSFNLNVIAACATTYNQ